MADNIPGLPGGEKSPPRNSKEYGSMENLLANTDKLKGKMKENKPTKKKVFI
jgi:DNA polymerase-1